MDRETRMKRLRFRAWHRGTKEADLMLGGFFDLHAAQWSDEEVLWYETLLNEEDVEIMGWAIGTIPCPDHYRNHPMMQALQKLDYIPVAK